MEVTFKCRMCGAKISGGLCPHCFADNMKEWEKADNSHMTCLACSHNSDKVCHPGCPHYPAKMKRS